VTDLTGARTTPAPSGGWRTATVRAITHVPRDAVVIRLEVPERVDHLPGQHYVLRLTGEDGYRAQRSYSLTSPPSDPLIEVFVDHLPDGEVSGYLAQDLRVGDTIEVRGPIGGWFVWDGQHAALCVGGGSGVAPYLSMLRHARDLGRTDLLRLVVAARTLPQLPYAQELVAAGAVVALSQQALDSRPPGRLSEDDLKPLIEDRQIGYVCGSSSFAESASQLLVALGKASTDIRVERFGPTG
jgi:ferredoxin-NADP reductase